MKALIFDGPNRLRVDRIPIPRPGPGELLVRIQVATICGTDVRIVSGRKTREVRTGHPIGHECAGTIAALGDGAGSLTVGDRVGICVVVTCGECEFCGTGKENLCGQRITLGYHTDGAFAEYMLIPPQAVRRGNVFQLPDTVPTESACLIEPMACCLNGQHEMGLHDVHSAAPPIRSLLIFGAGPIGLLHLLLAKARSPGLMVTVAEPREARRQMALELGADQVCAPEECRQSESFDAIILAVGIAELVDRALHLARPCGRVNLFAGFDQGAGATLDPNLVHYKQIRITGASESRRCDYAEALSLIADRRVHAGPLITHRFSLEQHREAFRMATEGTAIKVALQPTAQPAAWNA